MTHGCAPFKDCRFRNRSQAARSGSNAGGKSGYDLRHYHDDERASEFVIVPQRLVKFLKRGIIALL